MTRHALICDAIRTPCGRDAGALASVRADDSGAFPLADHDGADDIFWQSTSARNVLAATASAPDAVHLATIQHHRKA